MNDKKNFIKALTCPISLKIFNEPVTLSDGHTYEKKMIFEMIKTLNTSPLTREEFTDDFNNDIPINYTIKSIIESCLLNKMITYDDIFNDFYYKISIDFFESNGKNCELMKKIIDLHEKRNELEKIYNISETKCNLRECYFGSGNQYRGNPFNKTEINIKLIHLICKFSSFKMIKYIVEKGVDLESNYFNELKPIHIICHRGILEEIEYFISKGVNLESETIYGCKPIHYICKFQNHRNYFEMILLFIKKGVDMNFKNEAGDSALDLIWDHDDMDVFVNVMKELFKLENSKKRKATPRKKSILKKK